MIPLFLLGMQQTEAREACRPITLDIVVDASYSFFTSEEELLKTSRKLYEKGLDIPMKSKKTNEHNSDTYTITLSSSEKFIDKEFATYADFMEEFRGNPSIDWQKLSRAQFSLPLLSTDPKNEPYRAILQEFCRQALGFTIPEKKEIYLLDSTYGYASLLSDTLAHELGHALGLGHNSLPPAQGKRNIMAAGEDYSQGEYDFTNEDKKKIRSQQCGEKK